MNLRVRLHKPEQLDNLSLSGEVLDKTLASLKFINTYLGNQKQLNKAVLRYCKKLPIKKELRIVDIGCGGGDCIIHISKKLKKHNIRASFIGIDGNPKSIAYATQKNPDPKHINFSTADILDKSFVIPDCDLLISSHFIYHFNNTDLIGFIEHIQSKKVKRIIFSELYRSTFAYYLFKLVSVVLPVSDMAKKDGLIAIQRAFSIQELKKIMNNSNVEKYTITKKPFFRTITEIDIHK